jgi:hypothetical protein
MWPIFFKTLCLKTKKSIVNNRLFYFYQLSVVLAIQVDSVLYEKFHCQQFFEDDHENIVWNGYSKKSTKLLHAFNIGQTGGVNTNNNFNVFKLPITDQTTPSLM